MKKGVDYIGVGVGAVIINKEGKIFLSRRGPKSRNEIGKWEFPGGSVEFGERLEDATVREIKEEYDFEIEIVDLLDVCNHIIQEENQHWVSPTFIAKVKNGVPRIFEPEKCDGIGWFTIEEILKMPLSIITEYNIENLRKKYPEKIPDFYKE